MREHDDEMKSLRVKASPQAILELFDELDEEVKDEILSKFAASQIIERLEQHLKGETDYWGFSTSGYRWGSQIREAIAKIQGIEPEWKKDYESRIRSLEHKVGHFEKYYKWYFRAYHSDSMKDIDGWHGAGSKWARLIKEIGDV